MSEIERILDQLKRAYEGNAWHGPSVREVLAGVTAAQAHARPLETRTILGIGQHIAVWEDVGRRRLTGDRAPDRDYPRRTAAAGRHKRSCLGTG